MFLQADHEKRPLRLAALDLNSYSHAVNLGDIETFSSTKLRGSSNLIMILNCFFATNIFICVSESF